MAGPESGGFEPSPQRQESNPEFNTTLTETLSAYPELQALIDEHPESDPVRSKIIALLSSGDPKDGTVESKIKRIASGQVSGNYSPPYTRWQYSSDFKSLLNKIEPPIQQNQDELFRLNQAEYLLGQAKARLELITKTPHGKKSPLEEAHLRNEIEHWQRLVNNEGRTKPHKLTPQTKTKRS